MTLQRDGRHPELVQCQREQCGGDLLAAQFTEHLRASRRWSDEVADVPSLPVDQHEDDRLPARANVASL